MIKALRSIGWLRGALGALIVVGLMGAGGFPSRPKFQAVGVGTAAPTSPLPLSVLGASGAEISRFSMPTTGYISLYDSTGPTSRAYLGFGSSLLSTAAATDTVVRSDGDLKFAASGNNLGLTVTSTAVTVPGNLVISGTSITAPSATTTPWRAMAGASITTTTPTLNNSLGSFLTGGLAKNSTGDVTITFVGSAVTFCTATPADSGNNTIRMTTIGSSSVRVAMPADGTFHIVCVR